MFTGVNFLIIVYENLYAYFFESISPVVRIIYLFLFLILNNSQRVKHNWSDLVYGHTHTQLNFLNVWMVYVKKSIVFIFLFYVSLPPAAFQNFPCSAFLPFENRKPKYRAFCLFLVLILLDILWAYSICGLVFVVNLKSPWLLLL